MVDRTHGTRRRAGPTPGLAPQPPPARAVDFAILRDGKGECQIVATDDGERAELAKWLDETVFEVEGTPKLNPQAPGGVELVEPKFTLVQATPEPSPVNLRVPELERAAADDPRPRRGGAAPPEARAVFRLARRVGRRVPRHARRGRLRRDPHAEDRRRRRPRAVPTCSRVDYFGRRAFLAQSPQFYKQMMVGVFERVYEVGPVFRAEPHDTVRHLAEYVSLDAELGFIDDHRDGDGRAPRRARRHGAAIMQAASTRRARRCSTSRLPTSPTTIPRRRLHRRAGDDRARHRAKTVVGEPDLAPAHERWLGEWAAREHGSDFLFVVGYPMAKRPFYTHPNPERPAVLEQLRPALPRARARHRWPAPAPLRRLRRRARSRVPGPRAVRGVPRSVPPRHAAARRLRDRARSAGRLGSSEAATSARPRSSRATSTASSRDHVRLRRPGRAGHGWESRHRARHRRTLRRRRRPRRRVRAHRACSRRVAGERRVRHGRRARCRPGRRARRRHRGTARPPRRPRQQRRWRTARRYRDRVAAVQRRDHRPQPHRRRSCPRSWRTV